MKIALASDHAGFEYKERIKQLLERQGHEVRDFGAHSTEQWIIRISSARRLKRSLRLYANGASC